ncbi:MAG: cell division protein SepF [Acidimicrobiales bacterium]
MSILRRAMTYLGLVDDDLDDYEGYADEPAVVRSRPAGPDLADHTASPLRPLAPSHPEPPSAVTVAPRAAVVRPIAPSHSARPHVVTPSAFDDAKEIGDRLKASVPVIVNLQAVDSTLSRRLVDFCSGAGYVLNAEVKKVADRVLLLTPSNVEVSAEEKRRLQERGLYRP